MRGRVGRPRTHPLHPQSAWLLISGPGGREGEERAESVWGSRPAVGWGDLPPLPKLCSRIPRGLQFSKSESLGARLGWAQAGWVGEGAEEEERGLMNSSCGGPFLAWVLCEWGRRVYRGPTPNCSLGALLSYPRGTSLGWAPALCQRQCWGLLPRDLVEAQTAFSGRDGHSPSRRHRS